MENSHESVSEWIEGMKAGDEDAVAMLWERYFDRLCGFAYRKLGSSRKTVVDQHDLAAMAMHAIWAGARDGRFQKLENRDDLWQLLVMVASRKAANIHRQQKTRRERGEASLLSTSNPDQLLADVLESPSVDLTMDKIPVSCEELLGVLNDKLRAVALMRLAGYSNREIADERRCSVKTVERYMNLIRAHWLEHNLA